jgi:peptidoglycan hydrolase-like protein with peptidoglycan-binding domain
MASVSDIPCFTECRGPIDTWAMRFSVVVLTALVLAPAAAATGRSDVAAVQVALRAKGLYTGTIDGVAGPQTNVAVRRLQRRAGLAVDGIVGPATRRALGRFGRPELGSRQLKLGAVGWDVARLQFLLATKGFPSRTIDGAYGPHVQRAVRGFQRFAGLSVDGCAGPATIGAVLRSGTATIPIGLGWPLDAPVGDPFGPRPGGRFHTGIDLPAATGMPVRAAAAGRVAWAAWLAGGWGNLVTVADGHGVRTLYAHLSRIDVNVGQHVTRGAVLGAVGATGDATGPHLHFEVRVRGAAVDPLPALR